MHLTEIDEATVYTIIIEKNGVKKCNLIIANYDLGSFILEKSGYDQAKALARYKRANCSQIHADVNENEVYAPTGNISLARYIVDNNDVGPNGYMVGLKFSDIADAKAFCDIAYKEHAKYSNAVVQWFDRLNVLNPNSPCCFNTKKVVESEWFKSLDQAAVYDWAKEVVKKSRIKRETDLSFKSSTLEEDFCDIIPHLQVCEDAVMNPIILTHK